MRNVIVFIIVLFFFIALFFFLPKKQTIHPTVTIRNHTFAVEVAQTNEEKELGLGQRPSLDENNGMLFLFDTTKVLTFWMKGMQFPLDIIFIKDRRIMMIYQHVAPQPNTADMQLKYYASKEPVNYVLEINAGLSEKYGFQEGDEVLYENLRH